MKTVLTMCAAMCALSMYGCGGDEPAGPQVSTGVLIYNQRMASTLIKRAAESVTGIILDTRSSRLKIEVSTGLVADGAQDSNDWVTIYDSDQEALSCQRVFEPVTLAAGVYRNLRLTMDPQFVTWVCLFGQDTVDLPCQTLPVSVFSDGGLFRYNGNSFVSVASNERVGGFEVRAGGTTRLTYVSNFNTIDWTDADSSGVWSTGDSTDNETIVPGAVTMCDFVVK